MMPVAFVEGGPLGDAVPWELGVELRSEIMPAEDSHTRIKPLGLGLGNGRYAPVTNFASGHGHCTTAAAPHTRTGTCVRWELPLRAARFGTGKDLGLRSLAFLKF
jgi:hypothetical protein